VPRDKTLVKFAKVQLEFSLTTKGFDGYKDRLGALLFSSITMKISLSPISILSMTFVTTLADLQQAGDAIGQFTGPKLGNLGAITPITIEMTLNEQANLRELVNRAVASK
jgi:hypothetical protein